MVKKEEGKEEKAKEGRKGKGRLETGRNDRGVGKGEKRRKSCPLSFAGPYAKGGLRGL